MNLRFPDRLVSPAEGSCFLKHPRQPSASSLGRSAAHQPSCQDLNQDEKAIKLQTPPHSSREKLRYEQQKGCKPVSQWCKGKTSHSSAESHLNLETPRDVPPTFLGAGELPRTPGEPQTIASPPVAQWDVQATLRSPATAARVPLLSTASQHALFFLQEILQGHE